MTHTLYVSMVVLGLCAFTGCRSQSRDTRSTIGVGSNNVPGTSTDNAPVFADICVPTSLPPGRYLLRGVAGVESLPRPLWEVRVKKGCVHPLAVRVCPNELRVEQEGSVLRVASDTMKRCYEATVAHFDVGDSGIHVRVTFESKCGKKGKLLVEGDLARE